MTSASDTGAAPATGAGLVASVEEIVPFRGTIYAPWTPEQVAALNRYQTESGFHPFTCGNDDHSAAHEAYKAEHGGDYGQLVAHADGWRCPVCGYTQNWAHAFMSFDPDAIRASPVVDAVRMTHEFVEDVGVHVYRSDALNGLCATNKDRGAARAEAMAQLRCLCAFREVGEPPILWPEDEPG